MDTNPVDKHTQNDLCISVSHVGIYDADILNLAQRLTASCDAAEFAFTSVGRERLSQVSAAQSLLSAAVSEQECATEKI